MKKSEIKEGIKNIINSVKVVIENIEEIIEPYKNIKENLEEIQSIEEDNEIETCIDYDMVNSDTLRSCINNSGDIGFMQEQFDMLLADLENWQSEASESKSETIQEQYIDTIVEVRETLDVDSIESEEDLDNQLHDIISGLEEIEI